MAYNLKLKEYANGSLQLTYYDYPVLDGFDKQVISYDKEFRYESDRLEFGDDPECSPWGDALSSIINLGESDFSVLDTENLEIPALSEEELTKRHDRCVKSSLNRSIHKIYDLARNNIWEWFFTFTLNESAVKDRTDYAECSKKVCMWFNNIRKRLCPDIKYLIVPERHPSSSAWHFHALVSDVENLEFRIAKNNQEFVKDKYGNVVLNESGQPKRNKYFGDDLRVSYPDGNYIYNIVNYNETRYGFSTATKIVDTRKAVSYIVKYLTKDLGECTVGKRRYFQSNNLALPKIHFLLENKGTLSSAITLIENSFGVKVSTEYIKSVAIKQPNYSNTISYLEFNDSVSHFPLPGSGAAAGD